MDCSSALAVYREDYADVFFLYHNGSVRRNLGMWGNVERYRDRSLPLVYF